MVTTTQAVNEVFELYPDGRIPTVKERDSAVAKIKDTVSRGTTVSFVPGKFIVRGGGRTREFTAPRGDVIR